MSVIVLGMDMPECCLRCDFVRWHTGQAPYCVRLAYIEAILRDKGCIKSTAKPRERSPYEVLMK